MSKIEIGLWIAVVILAAALTYIYYRMYQLMDKMDTQYKAVYNTKQV